MTWHDATWRDMTWHDVTWRRDMTWRDVTWRGVTWRDVTWRDVTWLDMTWHDMTWHDMTWHDMNTLARVVAQKHRCCHITPVLADRHWLPIRHRISFKIATIAFRVLHFQQPSYLAALVSRYVPTRSLRSSSSLSICIPSRKTAIARSKSFSSVASDTWNRLPCHLYPFPLFLLSERDSSIVFFRVLSRYFFSIHWHHAWWCHHIHESKSQHMHLAA